MPTLIFEDKAQLSLDMANIAMIAITLFLGVLALVEFASNKRKEREDRTQSLEQAEREWKISREASSKSLYREYLMTALRYPELSIGRYDKDDLVSSDRYDTFVSIMLYSFDEIISISGKLHNEAALEFQIETHFDYLEGLLINNPSFRSSYCDDTLEIIDRKMGEIRADKKNIAQSKTA